MWLHDWIHNMSNQYLLYHTFIHINTQHLLMYTPTHHAYIFILQMAMARARLQSSIYTVCIYIYAYIYNIYSIYVYKLPRNLLTTSTLQCTFETTPSCCRDSAIHLQVSILPFLQVTSINRSFPIQIATQPAPGILETSTAPPSNVLLKFDMKPKGLD